MWNKLYDSWCYLVLYFPSGKPYFLIKAEYKEFLPLWLQVYLIHCMSRYRGRMGKVIMCNKADWQHDSSLFRDIQRFSRICDLKMQHENSVYNFIPTKV